MLNFIGLLVVFEFVVWIFLGVVEGEFVCNFLGVMVIFLDLDELGLGEMIVSFLFFIVFLINCFGFVMMFMGVVELEVGKVLLVIDKLGFVM